jgi:thiosulfate/3-mercaptopyruvate sulfurtransferase
VKKTFLALMMAVLLILSTGCASYDYAETGQYIVTAKEALNMVQSGAILVDVQSADDYATGHITGAVNVPMASLTISEPIENMLPDAAQIEQVMGAAGLTETDTLLVYDNNANMQAARVQWTLNMFGNFNVRVVSGGLKHLQKAGGTVTTEAVSLPAATYTTGDKQKTLIASLDYINAKLNTPEEGLVIIDARTAEEAAQGMIPGAINIDYALNNYPSGEYKSPMDMQSTYISKGILPDMKLIVYCKSGVRAAQTYTALKDAGYPEVRVYDGSWLEYSSTGEVEAPVSSVAPSKQDAS